MKLWKVFSSFEDCQVWCQQQFVAMAQAKAATNNGILYDYTNNRAPVDVTALPDADITGDRFPLWGKNAATHQWNEDSGFTVAWAQPRETAGGEWAAPCRDPNDPGGVPEPEWPEVEDGLL
jgi:hypothetical protein